MSSEDGNKKRKIEDDPSLDRDRRNVKPRVAEETALLSCSNNQQVWHTISELLDKIDGEEIKVAGTPLENLIQLKEKAQNENEGDIKDYNTLVNETLKICLNWNSAFKQVDRTILKILDEILELIAQQYITEHINQETKLITMENHEIKSLLADIPREILKAILAKLISTNSLMFPYKKFFESPAEQLFANLQRYKPTIAHKSFSPAGCKIFSLDLFPCKFNGDYCVLSNVDMNYNTIDVIADHFTEEQRMNAVRADQRESPMEYWQRNTIRLLEDIAQHGKAVTTHELREELYRHVRECTQFKPTVALSVYQLLHASKILDFSAGWGDRLIAAMAHSARYLGFDPNVDLRPGHLKAVRMLLPNKEKLPENEDEFPEDVKVIYEPFETAVIPTGMTFDLCCTSPPFFTFEIYTKHATQSVASFPSFAQWMKRFLFASLKKAWDALELNGHLAIHIVDAGRNKVVEPMNLFVQYSLSGAQYCGIIGAEGGSMKIFPVWVWRKTQHDDAAKQSQAKAQMQRYYRDLYY